MSGELPPVVVRLRELALDVLDAKASLHTVEASIAQILAARTQSQIDQEFDDIIVFVHELTKKVLDDVLAVRAAALARIAWRAQRWTSGRTATTVGLFCIDKLWSLDDFPAALDLAELVEADARARDDPQHAITRVLRARSLVSLSRMEEAESLIAAEEAGPQLGRDEQIAFALRSEGIESASALRRHQLAIARAQAAADAYDGGVTSRTEDGFLRLFFRGVRAATVYCALGNARRGALEHLSAIEAYARGRTRAFEEGDPRGAAYCLSEIAITWEHLSEWPRAAALLEQAASEAENLGDHASAARWRKQPVRSGAIVDLRGVNGLSAIVHALNTTGPSENLERELKTIIKEERHKPTTVAAMARNVLAGLYRKQKRWGLALAAARAATESAAAFQENWLAMSYRAHYALIAFMAEHGDSARSAAEQVLCEAEQFLQSARASEIRQAAMSAASHAAEILLYFDSSEYQRADSTIRPPDPVGAMRTVDRTRSRTFNHWLRLLDWSRQIGSDEVRRCMRALITQDVVIETAAQGAMPLNGALAARAAAEEKLHAALLRCGRSQPDDADELRVEDVKADMPAESACLDLNPVEGGIICLLIRKDAAPRIRLVHWCRDDRTRWHAAWRTAWAREAAALVRFNRDGGVSAGFVGSNGDVALGTAAQTMTDVYEELQREFVAHLEEWLSLGMRHLIVTLHAELAFLPLWALTRGRPDMTLSVLPSLRTVSILAARPAARGRDRLAIGDATGTLRMADIECRQLEGYTLAEPTLQALEDTAPSALRMHFAGHGEFDRDNSYLSGIVLRGPAQPPFAIGTRHSGCVRCTIPGVLARLDADQCELLTISACSVGTPRAHAASEFTSVPTAFLLAGARNVIAAAWQVHDGATAVLMAHFYRHLQTGLPISRALSRARDELGRTTRQQAISILADMELVPDDEFPFASPIFTDAVMHYGLS